VTRLWRGPRATGPGAAVRGGRVAPGRPRAAFRLQPRAPTACYDPSCPRRGGRRRFGGSLGQ
jgi:hypothetical protein